MPTRLAPGSTFAGYRIVELVGRGGMGVVYRATDLELDRPVALKLIAPELVSEEGFRKRFLRESRLAASLGHPHILPVYAAGEADGELFLAMRYVEGEDLKTLLVREGTLAPERALALLGQVAEALDAAHRKGLVHRDVKPGNVLLDEHAQAYLSDFGLTKQVGGASTQTGQLVGTFDYLAPEQIRGEDLDGRTDEYALACVLYECLAGTPPFRRKTEAEVLWAHMQEAPPRLPGIPQLDPVLTRALAKDRNDRYPTCAEIVDSAREALGFETPRLRRRRRLTRRSRVLLGAVALVLLGAIAAAVIELRGGESAKPVAVQPNSVAVIDPKTNRVVNDISVGNSPSGLALGDGAIWVLNGGDRTISRIDLASRSVRTISTGPNPTDLTLANGALWVVDVFARTVYRVNSQSGVIERTIRLPGLVQTGGYERVRNAAIASGRGAVWVSTWTIGPVPNTEFVWRIDPVRNRVVAIFRRSGGNVAVGGGAAWVVGVRAVLRIDTGSNALTTIDTSVHANAREVAAGAGAVWITDIYEGTLSKIGFVSENIERTITVGQSPTGVAVGAGSVWVANPVEGTIVRIDPTTATVVRSISLAGSPNGIAVGGGEVWITVD